MPLRRGILSQTLFVPVPARGPCPSPLTGLWRRAGAAGAQCSRAAASSAAAGSGGRAMPGGEERPGRAGSDMGRGGSRSAFYPPAAACPPPAPPSLPPSRPPPLLPFVLPSSGYSRAGRGDAARRYRGRSRPGTGPPRRSPAPPGFTPRWEGGSEAPGAAAGRRRAAGGCSTGWWGEEKENEEEEEEEVRGCALLPRADDAASPPAVCICSEAAPGCKLHTRCKRFLPVPELVSALTGMVFEIGTALRGSLGGGLKSGSEIPQMFTILRPVRALWGHKSSWSCLKEG